MTKESINEKYTKSDLVEILKEKNYTESFLSKATKSDLIDIYVSLNEPKQEFTAESPQKATRIPLSELY